MARTWSLFTLLCALLATVAAQGPAPSAKPPGAPVLSPEAEKAELEADLAALGVPTTDLAGRVVPGSNPIQINALLNSIITAKIADSFQKSTLAASQNTQQVLAALANPSAVPALSPAARNQFEAVVDLFQHPGFANAPQAAPAKAGRKLLAST